MYNEALQGRSRINHVFFYETTRNYIFPAIFTSVLDYSLSGGPMDWGWVNQGFIDVIGCLFSETLQQPSVEFYYYGSSRQQFMDMMEANLFTYMANLSFTWDNTFMQVGGATSQRVLLLCNPVFLLRLFLN